MKKTLMLLASILMGSACLAQESGFINKYFSGFLDGGSDASKSQILTYPTIGFSPETSTEIGLSNLFLYYAKEDTSNRLSEIASRVFYTFENQYGLIIEHALYTDQSEWFFLGNMRYQRFPISFFGVGINSSLSDEQLVNSTQFVIRERILRKVKNNFFAGMGIEYNLNTDVNFSEPREITQGSRVFGEKGASNLGLGIGLVWDSRKNVLNVRDGYFSEISLMTSNRAIGSDFNFTSLISDNRFFKSVRPNQVLALQLLGHFNWGQVPFNQLAQAGGANILRGYFLGRFRDNNMLVAQMEYRFLPLDLGFTQRVGAVIFGSTGTVSEDFSTISFNKFKGAAGLGLRFLLVPKKDIYVRLDYAITREGHGIYINVGEAY